ncbi:MAG: hypothetical protein P4L48_04575, partial [Mycobacterium sp.]|nr:hypothetical protein [Mycobacterium sp.]
MPTDHTALNVFIEGADDVDVFVGVEKLDGSGVVNPIEACSASLAAVGLLQPCYFAAPHRPRAGIADPVDLDHRGDPNGERDQHHDDIGCHAVLFGSAFDQAQDEQSDSDGQQRGGEVDHLAATVGVLAQ